MNDPHDITSEVFQRNDPWDSIDDFFGKVRDFFAVVGIFAVLGFVVGYCWVKA